MIKKRNKNYNPIEKEKEKEAIYTIQSSSLKKNSPITPRMIIDPAKKKLSIYLQAESSLSEIGPTSACGAKTPEAGLTSDTPGLGLLRDGLRFFGGASRATELLENGTTPARLAISCSPSCQCIFSAARQGIPISLATWLHISCLNLFLWKK